MTTLAREAPRIDDGALAHTAIRAAAGSGKTFQLTNRYLLLVAAGAEPTTILATTFTRLAAGQIRDRILSRLAEAVRDATKRAELAKHLKIDRLSRDDALDLLVHLARRMHVMQVRTLDSFFAALVRSFAIELEMPLDAEVVDEDQAAAMRAEAIRLMLDEHDPQRLVELLRLLTQGSSDRGVSNAIDRTVVNLYAIYRDAPAAAWECVPQKPGRLSPVKLIEAIQHLEHVACTGDKRFTKAHQADCENARAWDWSALLGSGLAKAIVAGTNTYYGKPIDDEIIEAYRPVIQHAQAELVARVREQTLATRDLLALFHRQYDKIKRRRRAITFDDLTAAAGRAARSDRIDEISFRLDARIHHLLLDEFQDTSMPQWRALEPLAREIVSVRPPERTFFCVGDVKQSIYGWRDAAPEVLDELPSLLRGPDGASAIAEENLAKSYRSSPVIMDGVNRVFSTLKTNAAVAEFPEAVQAWTQGFGLHDTAKTELPGYVELRLCRGGADAAAADEQRLREAATLAAALHHHRPALTIGLITRTNEAVARLLYELGPSRLAVPASGRGGGPLTDAAPVTVLLDLLTLADHPDDTIAAFNVAGSPAGAMLRLTRFDDAPNRKRAARQIRTRLLDEGYGRTIGEWVRQLADACDARELRRLRQLVELADQFDSHRPLRTSDFIEIVEQTRVADSQPAPVQVMTVHQSKGLEFDAVILADLGGSVTGATSPPVVVEREGETGPVTRLCRYMKNDTLDFVPELKPLFERHRRRTVRESLSVLYVAMTRAVHALYMLVDAPRTNKSGSPSQHGLKTLGGVVRCALAPDAGDPGTCFALGEPGWLDRLAEPEREPVEEPAPAHRIHLAPAADGGARRGESSSPAALVRSGSLRQELRLADAAARQRGIAIHRLFEQIEWLEELDCDPDRLASLVRQVAPRRGRDWSRACVRDFLTMLDQPAARELLCLGNRDRAGVQVRRELPFARLADGQVQTGIIDRVVVDRRDGCPAAACIVDFKTDDLAPADAGARAEHYRPQIECYRQAAGELFGLDAARVAATVFFVAAGAAVKLAHEPALR